VPQNPVDAAGYRRRVVPVRSGGEVTRTWSRTDVEIGQFWVKDNEVYKVVAIVEQPTVTLQRLNDGRADAALERYVISSPLFAQFTRLQRVWVDGSTDE